MLEISSYIEAASKLRPDVVIAPVDLGSGRMTPGQKSQGNMVERSTAWLRGLQAEIEGARRLGKPTSTIWVPILPIEPEVQKSYIEHLEDNAQSGFGGVVLYDENSISSVPSNMQGLPRISFYRPRSPHQILRSISLGIDLFTLPFITAASEAGIAFTFRFPVSDTGHGRLPLGADMWQPLHSRSLLPLQEDCKCYACRCHHRAYVQHLLSAKEMLAWVLLQIHNHHVIDDFFQGVRESIARGDFENCVEDFAKMYEDRFPEFKGQGPRYVNNALRTFL